MSELPGINAFSSGSNQQGERLRRRVILTQKKKDAWIILIFLYLFIMTDLVPLVSLRQYTGRRLEEHRQFSNCI